LQSWKTSEEPVLVANLCPLNHPWGFWKLENPFF
jgi:hypothetical protein